MEAGRERERGHTMQMEPELVVFMQGDHSLKIAFELGYIKGSRCTREVENRCKETLEVKQTSAGHGADPSSTKT